jgi:hypothetical protein
MKRLSEGDHSPRAEVQRRDVFRDALHPVHVGDSRLLTTPSARLQHAGLGINAVTWSNK